METRTSSSAPPEMPTAGISVVMAWLVVGAPLLWGVSQTLLKALDLFK